MKSAVHEAEGAARPPCRARRLAAARLRHSMELAKQAPAGLSGTFDRGQGARACHFINVWDMRPGRAAEADQGAEKSGAAKGSGSEERAGVPGQIYGEIQRQFRSCGDAIANLEKKAQNLMIASALVAALLVSLSIDSATAC